MWTWYFSVFEQQLLEDMKMQYYPINSVILTIAMCILSQPALDIRQKLSVSLVIPAAYVWGSGGTDHSDTIVTSWPLPHCWAKTFTHALALMHRFWWWSAQTCLLQCFYFHVTLRRQTESVCIHFEARNQENISSLNNRIEEEQRVPIVFDSSTSSPGIRPVHTDEGLLWVWHRDEFVLDCRKVMKKHTLAHVGLQRFCCV